MPQPVITQLRQAGVGRAGVGDDACNSLVPAALRPAGEKEAAGSFSTYSLWLTVGNVD